MLLAGRKHGGQSDHSKSNSPFHTIEISFVQKNPSKSMTRHKLSLIEAMVLETEMSMSLELSLWYF